MPNSHELSVCGRRNTRALGGGEGVGLVRVNMEHEYL